MTITRLNKTPMDYGVGQIIGGQPNAVNVPGTTWQQVMSVEIGAGTWVVCYGGAFASNSNGMRRIYLSIFGSGRLSPASAPANGEQTRMSASMIYEFASKTAVTMYASQSSGSALSFWPYLYAVRIA